MFRRVIEVVPDYDAVWINLGRTLLVQGRPEEAQACFLKALQLEADPGKVYFFLGVSAQDQGHIDEAVKHLRRAEAVYPRDRRILFQLGKTLRSQQQYEDAIEVFNARTFSSGPNEKAAQAAQRHNLLRMAGSDAHAYFEVGRTVLRLPNFSDADSFRTALASAEIIRKRSSPLVHFFSRYATLRKSLGWKSPECLPVKRSQGGS